MNTAYFFLTKEGASLAKKLSSSYPGDLYGKENFKENLRNAFSRYDYLVCIMATGIVVRILAPLIHHKTSDPGVVVLDQKGQFAISLLSGHLGGANALAREMAAISGGQAVITTATDVAGELSFDTFAQKYDIAIENIGQLKHISGTLLDGGQIRVYSDRHYPELDRAVSAGRILFSEQGSAGDTSSLEDIPTVVIDESFTFDKQPSFPVLYLRPRTIYAGIGCKRGMDAESITKALTSILEEEQLSPLSLKCICTIPLKAGEPGILTTAEHFQVPLTVISTEAIETLDINALGIETSSFVARQTGVLSVSTASAYLASGQGKILRDKAKFKGITIALCKKIK